jgi:hypothetical protein
VTQFRAHVDTDKYYDALQLFDEGHFGEAAFLFRELVSEARTPANLNGLAIALAQSGHITEARAMTEEALSLAPNDAEIELNLSLVAEAQGDFLAAWHHAEARWRSTNVQSFYPNAIELPRWVPSATMAPRVLIHWEQGFGDILQHLRFLHSAAAKDAAFTFECPQPLIRFGSDFPQVQFVPAFSNSAALERALQEHDAFCPLASLANTLRLERIPPWTGPYLGRILEEPIRSSGLTKHQLKIGIAWRSSGFDARRDIPWEEVAAGFAGLPKQAQLVPLLPDLSADEHAFFARYGAFEPLSDFYDTASRMRKCDLVITIDTACAHLAGALGSTTYLLLNTPCATRWISKDAAHAWYPSVRLVRKPPRQHWRTCIEHVLAGLV